MSLSFLYMEQKKLGRPVEKPDAEPFNVKIDKHLKKAFKIWCAQNDVTMTDQMEQMIQALTKKSKK